MYMTQTFCDDWVLKVDQEDRVSLGLFICFQTKTVLSIGDTEAAEHAAFMISRNEQTYANGGQNSLRIMEMCHRARKKIPEIRHSLVQLKL